MKISLSPDQPHRIAYHKYYGAIFAIACDVFSQIIDI